MADQNWLDTAVKNPQVQAWFSSLKARYPQEVKGNVKDWIKKDQLGSKVEDASQYDYKKAVSLGRFPQTDSLSGDLHWDDAGKNPKYWGKTMQNLLFNPIRRQEGRPKFDPSQQIDTTDKSILGSIPKNVTRWLSKYPDAMQPGNPSRAPDFITFMGNQGGKYGTGWARPGAPNDHYGTNKNWIPAVHSMLKQEVGQGEYDYLHSQNLALNQQQPQNQTAPWLNATSVARQA